jgi:hypothetical protein
VSETIGGLEPNTTYHFRVVATSSAGTTYGEDKTFKTQGAEAPEWEIQATPSEVEQSELADVSCAPGQCIAVGVDSSGPLVEVWDGEEWTIESNPAGVVELNNVECLVNVEACVAVGGKEGEAWVGVWSTSVGWQTLPMEKAPGSSSTLNGASCVGKDSTKECWVVGSYTEFGSDSPLAMRWSTVIGKWETIEAPSEGEGSELNAVSCNAVGSCVAAGHYTDFGDKHPLVTSWDGEEWSAEEPPSPEAEGADTYLSDVSCTGAAGPSTACVAVGANDNGAPQTPVGTLWNGEEWSLTTPVEPSEVEGDYALRGVSCVSETQCYAAGKYEVEGGETKTLIEEWDGAEWGVSLSPDPPGHPWSGLNDVSCSSSSDCVAVGSSSENGTQIYPLAMQLE